MDFRGRGNNVGGRQRGANDGRYQDSEGLRITVPNSEVQPGFDFEFDRMRNQPAPGRGYFDHPESTAFSSGGNRSTGSNVDPRAESIRITVGNDNFLLDQQRDPASRRLGPPVGQRANDPWGIQDLSTEERFRQGSPAINADVANALDALLGKGSILNALASQGSPLGRLGAESRPSQGSPLDRLGAESRPVTQPTFPILEGNQRGLHEPRLDAKPKKSALKSCLKKPGEKMVSTSGSFQSEYNRPLDSFPEFGLRQPNAAPADRHPQEQSFGRDFGFGQRGPTKSVEDEDRFLYGDDDAVKSGTTSAPTINPQSRSQIFPISSELTTDQILASVLQSHQQQQQQQSHQQQQQQQLQRQQESRNFPVSLPSKEELLRQAMLQQSSGLGLDISGRSSQYNPQQAAEVKPIREEPKKEEAEVPNDPTIANILKSIGFDFEMSRKMQERAKQEQTEQERLRATKKKKPKVPSPTDLGSFGINMNASFLGGGLAQADLKSALVEEKQKGYSDDRYEPQRVRSSLDDFPAFSDERGRSSMDRNLSQVDQRRSDFEADILQRARQSGQFDDLLNLGGRPQFQVQPDRQRGPEHFSREVDTRTLSPASRYRFQLEGRPGDDDGFNGRPGEQPPEVLRRPDLVDYPTRSRSRSRSPVDTSKSGGKPDVWQRLGISEDWFAKDRPSSKTKNLEVSIDSKSNRTVLPPKNDRDEADQRRVVRNDSKDQAPVLTSEERNKFHKEMNERRKRLSVLESEMERLRKQQNELMRKKQREKGGHKDPLLMENSKLQDVIAAQISVLRKAADDNEKMLKRSKNDWASERQEKKEQLSEKRPESRERHKHEDHGRRSREKHSPDHGRHGRSSRERSSRDRGRDSKSDSMKSPRTDDRKVNKEKDRRDSKDKPSRDSDSSSSRDRSVDDKGSRDAKDKKEGAQLRKPGTKSDTAATAPSGDKKSKEKAEISKSGISIKWNIRYEYFDPGNHWCKDCNMVLTNVYDVFDHLHSKKHNVNVNQYDRPWMPDELKTESQAQPKKGQTAVAAMRGVEFMMGAKAYYCRLCQSFSGDPMCAEQHLKSNEHNEKYRKYLEENPFYEKRFNLDKAAGVSAVKKEEGQTEKRKVEESTKSSLSKKPRWVEASDEEEDEKPVEMQYKKSNLYLPDHIVPGTRIGTRIKKEQPVVVKKEEPKFGGFKLGGKISTPNWVMMQKNKGQTATKNQTSTTVTTTSTAAKPIVGSSLPLRKTKPVLLPAKIDPDERSRSSDGRKSPDSLDMFLTISNQSKKMSKALPVVKEIPVPQDALASAFSGTKTSSSTPPTKTAASPPPERTFDSIPLPPPAPLSKPKEEATVKTTSMFETDDTDEDLKLLGIDRSSLQPAHIPRPPPQVIKPETTEEHARPDDHNDSNHDDFDDGASSGSGISMEMGSDFEVLDECEED